MDGVLVAANEYRKRVRQRRENAERYAYRLGKTAKRLRMSAFAIIGYTVFDPSVAFILFPVGIVYVSVVAFQCRLAYRLGRERRAVRHFENALLRIEGGWIGCGDSGERYLRKDELFADDLDLFGPGSLFEFLCTARTASGKDTLAEWLRASAQPAEIVERQDAVKELRTDVDFRERLAVVELNEIDSEALSRWHRAPPPFSVAPTRLLGLVVAYALFGSFAVWIVYDRGGQLLLGTLALQFVFYFVHRSHIRNISEDAHDAMKTMRFLARIGSQLRDKSFSCRRLARIRSSVSTKRGLISSASLMAYGVVGTIPMLQSLVCQAFPQSDKWRQRIGKGALGQLESMGELEAVSSLSQFAYGQSDTVFPEIINEVCFDALELGHPLIAPDDRVTNDVSLGREPQMLLVSGSNMSGKSTLMRTVGINAVLALCGAPVCAKKLRISLLVIGTAMRFQDSLEHGTSHFFAVLRRLRSVMERLQNKERPLLFLIDEILQGTNSHDRLVGSEALIRKLVEGGAIGLVSTHDLELTRIVDGLGHRAANVHFVDAVVDGQIRFDYKMRPGIVKTSNAILLMRKMGMDV